MALTLKQIEYVKYRIKGFSQSSAAVEAGYSESSASGIAHRMESNPKISKAIADGRVAAEQSASPVKEPEFDDAESYLEAVVRGSIAPDMRRISAAKTLIAYQRARERAPVKAKSPSQMRSSNALQTSREWAEKSAAIREKISSKQKGI
jgi:phage terminase small subunit